MELISVMYKWNPGIISSFLQIFSWSTFYKFEFADSKIVYISKENKAIKYSKYINRWNK